MNKNKKKRKENAYVTKHNLEIYRVMKRVLLVEQWDNTLSDYKLSARIQAEGVLCSRTQCRDVRLKYGIAGSPERKIENFAKKF